MMIDYHCHQQLKIINVIWATISVFRSRFFLPRLFPMQKKSSTQVGLQIQYKNTILSSFRTNYKS